MGECKLCGRNGEDLTLRSADHKDLGRIMVCSDCWRKLWNKNSMVCGTSGSGGTCPSCR
jgi:predicted SprT family Zn-dependent metalloprotease